MDFVHYQPPQERHAKAKADRKNSAKSMDQADDSGHSDAKDKASQDGSDRSKAGGKGDGADLDGSTRPRLSPEQVWLLEQQFQAEPKPNSHTKRHLAGLTSLSLPRVANWFQNRRAKAKQQRRLAEIEQTRVLQDERNAELMNLALRAHQTPFWLSGLSAELFAPVPTVPSVGAAALNGVTLPQSEALPGPDASSTESYRSLIQSLLTFDDSPTMVAAATAAPSSVCIDENLPVSSVCDPPVALPDDRFVKGLDMNLLSNGSGSMYADGMTGWPPAYCAPTEPTGFEIPDGISNQPLLPFDQGLLDAKEMAEAIASSSRSMAEHRVTESPLSLNVDANMSSGAIPLHIDTGAIEAALGSSAGRAGHAASRATSQALVATSPCDANGMMTSSEPLPSLMSTASSSGVDLAARRKRPRPATLHHMPSHGLAETSPTWASSSSSLKPFTLDSSALAQRRKSISGRIQKPRARSTPLSPLQTAPFAEAISRENTSFRRSDGIVTSDASARGGNSSRKSGGVMMKRPPQTPTPSSENESAWPKALDASEVAAEAASSRCRRVDASFPPPPPLQTSSNLASPPITPIATTLPDLQACFLPFTRSPIGSDDPLSATQLSAPTEDAIFSPRFSSLASPMQVPSPLSALHASISSHSDMDMTSFLNDLDPSHPAAPLKAEIQSSFLASLMQGLVGTGVETRARVTTATGTMAETPDVSPVTAATAAAPWSTTATATTSSSNVDAAAAATTSAEDVTDTHDDNSSSSNSQARTYIFFNSNPADFRRAHYDDFEE
ncbi:MAG: hypothetical protein M1815_000031 [Lichina confinis]|nr:MAG: hypothetical protein M1815_000031 [Lichina confinis]